MRALRIAVAVLAASACGERVHPRTPPRERHGERRAAARHVLSSLATLLAVSPRAMAQDAGADVLLPPEVKEQFAKLDTNGDGSLDKEEFFALVGKQTEDTDDEVVTQRVHKQYERLFAAADMDGDGLLNVRELDYMRTLHEQLMLHELRQGLIKSFANPDAKEPVTASAGEGKEDADLFGTAHFQAQLDTCDTSGNGVIEKDEFLAAMHHTAMNLWSIGPYIDEPEFSAWLDALWEHADINGDGSLTAKEVQYVAFVAGRMWQTGMFARLVVANTVLREIDLNSDGEIGLDEVTTMTERSLAGSGAEGASIGNESPQNVVGQIQASWAEFDTNGDDRLDRSEILGMCSALFDEL